MTAGGLNRFEKVVYFVVYIAYIVIGLYKIYALRDRVLSTSQFQFAEGWRLLQRGNEVRLRDNSNDELENFGDFLATFWPYYLLHALLSGVLRWKWPHLLHHGYVAVSALALLLNLHWTSLAMLSALIVSYYLSAQRRSKRLTWLLSGLWVVAINIAKNSQWWLNQVGYAEYVMLIVTLSWSVLRGCSYSLKKVDNAGFVEYLGYATYFPCLTHGPFISYERFVQQPIEGECESSKDSWKRFLLALLRVGFWWLMMHWALHFFYIHYMGRDVRVVAMMDSVFWQHSAGYFMGQFFFMYYVVTYGLGIAFAKQDGIAAPRRPRCIGRIHFYSDMWKYFDEGLYEFLFKHIYAELCGKQSSVMAKVCATAFTFAFVFIWHGLHTDVLIWSVLNFLCLGAEKIYRALVSLPAYQQWSLQLFGSAGAQRFQALLATQLFIPAAFSNVYFIGGKEIGDFLMRGAYLSGVGNYLALCFCSYCFFQCSELLLSRTTNHKDKIKST
ncbi:protein-cysteine N-palmitoyltransferase Rasp [Drosophila innubila]|uniref:protein-cysteine N-palmitoyltransferase Rasp n=1 Tax=Drosophila innubila TaxID=198719 RepID=UPI00148D768E|nr:protein-cysteine N-palmitoyltransferase Rasp [Drosophila innubila]